MSVSLVRLMSCTHHYEPNQRLIWLQILSKGTNSVTVSAPINPNVAPPGYYMIHVLDATGVPSVAKIISIPGINNPETFYNVSIPGNKAAASERRRIYKIWRRGHKCIVRPCRKISKILEGKATEKPVLHQGSSRQK